MAISREVREGRQSQGIDEQIAYKLTTTPWGGSPTSPSAKLYDCTGTTFTDVSSSCLSGSPAVLGDVITSPKVQGLTKGNLYRLEFQWTYSGNLLEAFVIIKAEQ